MATATRIDPRIIEWKKCSLSSAYFIHTYCRVYDSESGGNWIPFRLWDAQRNVLAVMDENQLVAILKARQLGLSWLALGYALWQMLFHPIATVLIFNKRDDEAVYLLGEERLRGMYNRLPEWMQCERVLIDDKHQFMLSNGSVARAFPTTGGDGFTATLAIVDEADIVPNLKQLLNAVRPTIEAGGKLFLISRSDKQSPGSHFKSIYRGGRDKKNSYATIFLPWFAHPKRTQAWYDKLCEDAMTNEGSLDSVHEQYPATDEEAMNPASLHKRIPAVWLDQCWEELDTIDINPLALEDLIVYHAPEKFRKYVGGTDCAEGLLTSDDSVTIWADAETGEQVAVLAGKLSPEVHAAYSAKISEWYNGAKLMIENNNHGHAFILWMNDNGYSSLVMEGHNKKKGWTSNGLGKVLMYDTAAESARTGDFLIHHPKTLHQLKAIEKSTLKAPQGEGENSLEDHADAWALTLEARKALGRNTYNYRQAATNYGAVQKR